MVDIVEQSTATVPRRRIFLLLLLAGMVGVFVFSYAMITYNLPTLIERMAVDASQFPPNIILIIISTIQPTILIALAIWGGLTLAERMGVNITPILTSARDQTISLLATGLGLGFIAGLVMLVAHQWIFLPLTGIPVNATANYPLWLAMTSALLYGGIVEELLMRLGLMTFLLWIGTKIQGGNALRPGRRTFWIVNIIVTLIFGLLHVVSAPVLLDVVITPMVIIQAIVLNSVALLFGWLYWHKGLETVIAAHMGVHLSYTFIALALL